MDPDGEDQNQEMVAVINIKTPIYKYSQECGPRGTKDIIKTMERLKGNSDIAGVVLDTDSGGGQVYGTPEFYDYVKAYSKPVVTYTDGLLCSAAYYFAAASSHIVANKRAEAIGSIGAYAQFLDLSGYYEKQGAKIHTVYAEKSTEKNKSYRDLMAGDPKTYIKEDLNPIVDEFISDIKDVRPKISEDVFKGATYNANISLEKGLIDSIGTLQDAIDKVFELKNSNSNKSQNTMSKPQSFPNLEKVLGLETPLAETENGSYLQGEQKTTIENALSANATALKNAKAAQAQAEADLQAEKDAHAAALTAEKDSTVAVVAALRTAATEAGVEDLAEDASAEDIQTALTAKIQELNGKPGASHTTGAAQDDEKGEFAYLDFDNSIYSQLKQ